KHARQFAFDGVADTYYSSAKNPGKDDAVTLVFDAPVTVKSIAVTTGKADGGDKLTAGSLEVSEDGNSFEPLAKFTDGTARGTPGHKLKAVRVKPGETNHPLVIREFAVESDPPVATFKHPVEIFAWSEDPEMTEWVMKAARICEREYDMICEELKSDGYKPRTEFTMDLTNDYRGVAQTSGGAEVLGSVRFFKRHKDDFGAMFHETVHVAQMYRRGNGRDVGWLVEGIPDYLRFFKYEPGKIGPIDRVEWKYNGAYRQSAHFLNYVTERYDKEIVRKINAALREGKYKPELWKEYTKKPLEELAKEWKESLSQ
ncbi:MAG TPA: basic secretory protein-like protein, partial [Gemmataceae bacterium]|nr:basic secretory protein-like protein [Gemmataceae bacterium]